jgi:putative two-component system response regulator
VELRDVTSQQKYVENLEGNRHDLELEVEAKTQKIIHIQDSIITGIASMVESRDNSTGDHIRRTSEGIRIFIEQLKKHPDYEDMTENFCLNVIKAAPMHDLGKIAVDDAILRKPGKFTDEEYEKMKQHPAEGAKVIHKILLHTDDESFKSVAENVAHYHHERWDGKGYPEGLAGERIPLEARIMAVADVYDALVSKRVYKEAFDFDKANAIILEGMGSQFDPSLKEVYEKARPRLEAFYQKEATS